MMDNRSKFRSEFGSMSPQLSGLFTSLVVLIVLLLIGPLFYFLPKVRLPLYRSYRCEKQRDSRVWAFSHPLGSSGVHQCYQPPADVLAVPGLT